MLKKFSLASKFCQVDQLLDWNMTCCADCVVSSTIELVGMRKDALVFKIGPTKTDQEGKYNVDHPFHIYSCPENPSIFPVLSICEHLIKRPQIIVSCLRGL